MSAIMRPLIIRECAPRLTPWMCSGQQHLIWQHVGIKHPLPDFNTALFDQSAMGQRDDHKNHLALILTWRTDSSTIISGCTNSSNKLNPKFKLHNPSSPVLSQARLQLTNTLDIHQMKQTQLFYIIERQSRQQLFKRARLQRLMPPCLSLQWQLQRYRHLLQNRTKRLVQTIRLFRPPPQNLKATKLRSDRWVQQPP